MTTFESPNKYIYVPNKCNDSDGNRVIKDIHGNLINLARCKLLTKEQIDNGETDFCDEIRTFMKCPRGYK
jgi:hypothetical protein